MTIKSIKFCIEKGKFEFYRVDSINIFAGHLAIGIFVFDKTQKIILKMIHRVSIFRRNYNFSTPNLQPQSSDCNCCCEMNTSGARYGIIIWILVALNLTGCIWAIQTQNDVEEWDYFLSVDESDTVLINNNVEELLPIETFALVTQFKNKPLATSDSFSVDSDHLYREMDNDSPSEVLHCSPFRKRTSTEKSLNNSRNEEAEDGALQFENDELFDTAGNTTEPVKEVKNELRNPDLSEDVQFVNDSEPIQTIDVAKCSSFYDEPKIEPEHVVSDNDSDSLVYKPEGFRADCHYPQAPEQTKTTNSQHTSISKVPKTHQKKPRKSKKSEKKLGEFQPSKPVLAPSHTQFNTMQNANPITLNQHVLKLNHLLISLSFSVYSDYNLFDTFVKIQSSLHLEIPANLLQTILFLQVLQIEQADFIEVILFCAANFKSSFSVIFFDWFGTIKPLFCALIVMDQLLMKESEFMLQLLQIYPCELKNAFPVTKQKEEFCNFFFHHKLSHFSTVQKAMERIKLIIRIKNQALNDSQLINEIIAFVKKYECVSGLVMICLLEFKRFVVFKQIVEYSMKLKTSIFNQFSLQNGNKTFKLDELNIFWSYFVQNYLSIENNMLSVCKILATASLDELVLLSKHCIMPQDSKCLQILIALCTSNESYIVAILLAHKLAHFPLLFVNWISGYLKSQHSIAKILFHNLPYFRSFVNSRRFYNLLFQNFKFKFVADIVSGGTG